MTAPNPAPKTASKERTAWIEWLRGQTALRLHEINEKSPIAPDVLDEVFQEYRLAYALNNDSLSLYLQWGLIQPHHMARLLELRTEQLKQRELERQARCKAGGLRYSVRR